MAFSDLWQADSDNEDFWHGVDEDLEGHEELLFDRSPQPEPEVDPLRIHKGKRNLMLGLVGFIMLIGSLWLAIARIQ